MTVPTIGGTRGIFEIFVPGLFLLLNLLAVVYFSPFTRIETMQQIVTLLSNQALSLILLIVFGYLIGVILRVVRTDFVDDLSGKCLKLFDANAHKGEAEDNLYVYEKFPYIGWIGVECQRSLPQRVNDFYKRVWAKGIASFTEKEYKILIEGSPEIEDILKSVCITTSVNIYIDTTRLSTEQRAILGNTYDEIMKKVKRKDKQFLNFCKIMIISADEKSANEMYSAEALSRYIAEMFYALSISSALLFVIVLLRLIILGKIPGILLVILFGYLFAIIEILKNFRFIRIKEVGTVFSASFKNRELFEPEFKEPL